MPGGPGRAERRNAGKKGAYGGNRRDTFRPSEFPARAEKYFKENVQVWVRDFRLTIVFPSLKLNLSASFSSTQAPFEETF